LASDEAKWHEVHTAHFNVLTDAGEKRGREVALRMEQIRTLFGQLLLRDKLKMSLPITVIALKSDKYFGFIAPTKQNMSKAFYVPGNDRVYIVLNLFEPDPWRAIAHPLVHYLINKNKLAETGVYFDLVLNQKVPVEKAIVQAFDMTPATFEEAVKTYFHSLSNLGIAMDRSKQPLDQADVAQPYHLPAPIG